jgi:hypothetical protein
MEKKKENITKEIRAVIYNRKQHKSKYTNYRKLPGCTTT